MQHAMQKKIDLKKQTKNNCRKKVQKKIIPFHKCTKNANAKKRNAKQI
jgi:hypothetical protein